MLTPISRIARIAMGRTCVASVPAENASKRSPARWRSKPSAIWLRAELCVQRNSTRRLFISRPYLCARRRLVVHHGLFLVLRRGTDEQVVQGGSDRTTQQGT